MSMFSRWFKSKPALDHPSADKRRQALATLTPESAGEQQEVLLALAVDDSEQAIRDAALNLVTDVTRLLEVLDKDPQATRIALRVVELDRSLATQSVPLFVTCLNTATDEERAALIESVQDPDLVAQTAVESTPATDALLAAATRLGEAGLSTLEKRSRNKNKKINRYARDQLDRLRTLKVDLAQHVQRSDELINKTSRVTEESIARVEHHVKTLKMCRDNIGWIDAQLSQFGQSACDTAAIEHALEQLSEMLNARNSLPPAVSEPTDHANQTAQPAAPVAVAVAVAVDNAVFEHLCRAFVTLEQRLTEVPIDPDVAQQRQQLTSQWMVQCESHPPGDDERAIFDRVTRRFNQLQDLADRLSHLDLPNIDSQAFPEVWPDQPDAAQVQWRDLDRKKRMLSDGRKRVKALTWPDELPVPDAIGAFTNQLAELATEIDRAMTFQTDLVEQLAATVLKLHLHLDNGELTPALSAHNEARRLDRCLPASFDHPARKSLKQIQRKLEELRDWQVFATSPKRQGLMDAIFRLADEPLAPEDQAGRIKTLRSDWMALGAPGNAHEYRLNDQFNQAAERAFEPCRQYFAAQAELRGKNLDARKRMCAQLETYLNEVDWSNADIRAAEKIMRTARAEWQHYHPVDKRAAKAVEVRFEAAQTTLHDHIKAAGVANLADKQNIVDTAQQILEDPDPLDQRIQKIKDLQKKWQAVGPTPRGPDQTLWKQFRQICDAAFEQRTELNNQHKEQIQQTLLAADALIIDIQTLRAADQPKPDSLSDIRNQINALASLPDPQRKQLEQAFADLEAHYRRCRRIREAEALRVRLYTIKQWDQTLSEAETRGIEPVGDLTSGTDATFLAGVFDKRQTLADDDLNETCRTLVVKAELLAGLESPDEDKDLRLILQVEQLKARIGQKAANDGLDDLLAQWCAIGGKGPSVEPLRERMFIALEILTQAEHAKVTL